MELEGRGRKKNIQKRGREESGAASIHLPRLKSLKGMSHLQGVESSRGQDLLSPEVQAGLREAFLPIVRHRFLGLPLAGALSSSQLHSWFRFLLGMILR